MIGGVEDPADHGLAGSTRTGWRWISRFVVRFLWSLPTVRVRVGACRTSGTHRCEVPTRVRSGRSGHPDPWGMGRGPMDERREGNH